MMMVMMFLGLIAPLLLTVAVAIAVSRHPQPNQTGPPQFSQTPADILKARYASGEITREEYEQMNQDMEG